MRSAAAASRPGFDAYLSKPAPRERIHEILHAVAEGRRAPASRRCRSGSDASGPEDPVDVDPDLLGALPRFVETRAALVEELHAALLAGERETVRRLAHKLAGSLALYRFAWAADESRAIQRAAADGGDLACAGRALRGIAPPPRHVHTTRQGRTMGARRKLLLVDDDEAVIEYLNVKLGGEFELMATGSPEKVLPLALDGQPDLVLCDIDLPGMDGGDISAALFAQSADARHPAGVPHRAGVARRPARAGQPARRTQRDLQAVPDRGNRGTDKGGDRIAQVAAGGG